MLEGTLQGLCLGGRPVPDGATLHEDDRMVTVAARNGRRQPEHIPGLGTARDALEAHGGNVVALVDHQMPVVVDDVVHFPVAYQALYHSDIDKATRLAPATADLPDRRCRKIQALAER